MEALLVVVVLVKLMVMREKKQPNITDQTLLVYSVLLLKHLATSNKRKSITTLTEMRVRGTLCAPLTLTDVHSFAQTNELLSHISVCYESVTWLHCAPFPISSFIDSPFCCYFERGIWSEWAMTHIQPHVCVYPRIKKCRQGRVHTHT